MLMLAIAASDSDRELQEPKQITPINPAYILDFLTEDELVAELHERLWRHQAGESYQLMTWKATFRAASKHRNGLYPIRGKKGKLKLCLRCDVCLPGKKRLAMYAEYERLMLYCAEH